MATVHLRGVEQQVWDRLPSVCMCCGEPATRSKFKRFEWVPRWAMWLFALGVLPGLVVMFVRKRMSMHMPVCDRHKWPFFKQTLMAMAFLGYMLLVPFLLIVLGVAATRALGHGRGATVMLSLFGVWFAGLVALFISVLLMKKKLIRPVRITDDTMVLTGVSEAFAQRMR